MTVIDWDAFLLPYRQTVDELCLKFNYLSQELYAKEEVSPIAHVEGRVKKVGSILEKAFRKNIPYDEIKEKIEDIAGVRITCLFVEDIQKVVELIRKRVGTDINMLQERDYLENIKPSGYRSYHILLKYTLITSLGNEQVSAEIQIRTLTMDFWANIEHSLRYKYNGNIPGDIQERLLSSAEAAFKLDKEMGTIRDEIRGAQKISKIKEDLVSGILKNIQYLHFVVQLDKMNELNKKFFVLYEEGNLEKLYQFSQSLKTMAEMYRVKY